LAGPYPLNVRIATAAWLADYLDVAGR